MLVSQVFYSARRNQMPRSRYSGDEDYNPQKEVAKRKQKQKSRRRTARKQENLKRSKDQIKKVNS